MIYSYINPIWHAKRSMSFMKYYRYRVFDNGKLLKEINEDAYKSKKSLLMNNREKIASTGDVKKIYLGEGIHSITIEDTDVNRDLIFRFYISKELD